MTKLRFLSWLVFLFVLGGCAAYRVAGQVQSGRQALMISNSEAALAYFQQAVDTNPNYIYESVDFREGVWTYLGRAQYNLTKYEEARRSFERALSVYRDDLLARLYLGLSLARLGDQTRARREIEAGLKGLNDWIEYMNASRPFQAFWDPRREIRSATEKELKVIGGRDINWQTLIETGEWVGRKMEEEIEAVRRDYRLQYERDRDRWPRSGLSIGFGLGF
jgi:tetratricopeptide (TPR) repeat protein